MSDLLVGWSLEGKKDSKRLALKSVKASRFSDLSKAEKYEQEGHLITFAPTGAGKGVRVIIPNLLHYDGPIITIDPKGENFAITARYRKEVLGQRIFLLDPFEFVKNDTLKKIGVERASLNPLDLIRASGANMETQLTMTASSFSTQKGFSSKDGAFWDNEAQKLIVGILGYIIDESIHTNNPVSFQKFINTLYADDVNYSLRVILDTLGRKLSDITKKSINAFIQKADSERSGVLSTAQSYLNPLMSPSLNKYLNSSSITSKDLSETDDYTVYIVIPPSKLVSHSILLRLWISTMLSTIMERDEHPSKKTLFLLDECAQLGTLDGLKKAITLLRGYGLQVWMFFQDFSQLTSLYGGDYETLINNCGVVQVFGIPRFASAAPILKIIGEDYEVEQLISLDNSQQVTSIANKGTKILRMCNYLTDDAFKIRFDENPLYKRKKIKGEIYPFPMNHLKINI